MLSELRLYGTDLQVHFALVARLVHLLGEDLLYRDGCARLVLVVQAENCALWRDRRRGDWRDVAARTRLLFNEGRVVVGEGGELELILVGCSACVHWRRLDKLLSAVVQVD